MSNNQSPTAYGQEYATTLRNRWNSAFGLAVRRMTPIVWPGVPPEAFLGFSSIAGSMNAGAVNTSDPPVLNTFSEVGYFQTEAGERGGPAPSPDPHATYNNWGLYHDDPLVIRALGHAASMVPDAWKQLPEDQAAVGLVNLRHYVDHLATQLPASIRPTRYDTMYAVAMAFTAFSAGTGGARGLFSRYATQLAAVPEERRWQQLVYLLANDIQSGFQPSGGPGRHGNVAYDALRTMQKLEAGRQLAVSTGGNAAWFDMGVGEAKGAEEALIQRAAYGDSTHGIGALSAPVFATGGKIMKGVAAVGLLFIAWKVLAPVVEPSAGRRRKNPTEPTLRAHDLSTGPTFPGWRDTLHSTGRYRVMKSGDVAPCKSCKMPTRTVALVEEAGERGYSFLPVCKTHVGELRAAYDREGYIEHFRDNPSHGIPVCFVPRPNAEKKYTGVLEPGTKGTIEPQVFVFRGVDCTAFEGVLVPIEDLEATRYDHEKLLLAVRNHPGAPAGIDELSYEELYKVARKLRIRG